MSARASLKVIADQSEWSSWKWQLKNTIRTAAGLDQELGLSKEEFAAAERAEKAGFPIAVTPYYLSLIDRENPDCGVRKQVIPQAPKVQ